MTRPSADAVRWFDALAPAYRRHYGAGGSLWHRHFFGGRLALALRWLGEVEGVVADVGAGPGPLTAALAERGVRVVALDRSDAMLRAARAGGALAARADALRLPLQGGACDAACALGLASYVDDLPALFAELRRVVRPGGVVVVSVAVASAPDWWLRRALRAPAARLRVGGLLTSGVTLHTRTRAAWRAAAAAAGLVLEEEQGHDFTLFPASRVLPGPSVLFSRAVEALRAPRLAPLASEVVLRLRVPGPVRARRAPPRRPRVVRVIARLNVGGPALHTVLATRGLAPRYDTVLATGQVAPGEVEAAHLLTRFGVVPTRIRGLGRAPSVVDDLRAFAGLLALLRRVRPDLVHTHTAKAGALGRVAAYVCGVPRVVHTFHGHVFHGYFGPALSRAVVLFERALARLCERVLAVSHEVAEDVVTRYRVAPRERVRVVPVGLPLAELAADTERRRAARALLGIAADAPVVAFVGRLVPVKEPDVALDAFARVLVRHPTARLLVAGGGPLLAPLRARGVPNVHWLGWRDDVADVLAAADVALLSSRNEGTPVALIEAAAAGVPAVATRVGGVPSVVVDGESGLLVTAGDAPALADAVCRLLADAELRARLGAAARTRALAGWSAERLLADLDALYRELLAPQRGAAAQNS